MGAYDEYYICCECGRIHTLAAMYSTTERCSECAWKYDKEQSEIRRKREAEEERIRQKREEEDEREERLRNGGAW